MIITSLSFNNNEKIPSKFTCDGGNINPELSIQNVPNESKALVLIVEDFDAPPGISTHWLVWNINPKTEVIKQESVPPGAIQGKNDTGGYGYTSPCPPHGESHRYSFKLYTLKKSVNLNREVSKIELEAAIKNTTIEKANLVGTYKRK